MSLQLFFDQMVSKIRYHAAQDIGQITKDIPASDWEIIKRVSPFTMTSPERIYCLINAVRYIVRQNIPGDFVECGVWKGGSMMAVALTLLEMKVHDRKLFLFDTYSGMPEPGKNDIASDGYNGREYFLKVKEGDYSDWCKAEVKIVANAMISTGYPVEYIEFIEGMVEKSIPHHAPNKIALARLDTDFYESTRHELLHLFPSISSGGILIIDDYGYWEGVKKAVDEYFYECPIPIFLNRIDQSGRIAVKP